MPTTHPLTTELFVACFHLAGFGGHVLQERVQSRSRRGSGAEIVPADSLAGSPGLPQRTLRRRCTYMALRWLTSFHPPRRVYGAGVGRCRQSREGRPALPERHRRQAKALAAQIFTILTTRRVQLFRQNLEKAKAEWRKLPVPRRARRGVARERSEQLDTRSKRATLEFSGARLFDGGHQEARERLCPRRIPDICSGGCLEDLSYPPRCRVVPSKAVLDSVGPDGKGRGRLRSFSGRQDSIEEVEPSSWWTRRPHRSCTRSGSDRTSSNVASPTRQNRRPRRARHKRRDRLRHDSFSRQERRLFETLRKWRYRGSGRDKALARS